MSGQEYAQRFRQLFVPSLLVACVAGCGKRETRLQVLDHRQDGTSVEYFQGFEECFYRRDATGDLEIVGQHTSHNVPGIQTRQVIYVKVIWTPLPGRTRAESTMLNAVVKYFLLAWPTGASFEGAGFF